MGSHLLMAAGALKSMGFKLAYGYNMYIIVKRDSKEKTKRIFDALADGGKVTMPLADMFWGAYFGTCTDKYGIN